jgi:predicted transcriptional regulator
MPSKNRTKTDIVAQILEAASGNWVIQTKILYNAFLSYSQLKEYLPLVIENNLLEYRSDNQTYKTTERGRHFLKLYHSVDDYIYNSRVQNIA